MAADNTAGRDAPREHNAGGSSPGTDDERLVAAMEHIIQGEEHVRLLKALEDLARAEEEVGEAFQALGDSERSQEMYQHAVRHFQEAAAQARAIAEKRRREREILDSQRRDAAKAATPRQP